MEFNSKKKYSFDPFDSLKDTKMLAIAAMLAAMSIVLGKFLAISVGNSNRISFENLSLLIAGMFYGPYIGAIVGIAADLIGCLLRGYAINPIVTLGAAGIGFISGALFNYVFKRSFKFPKILCSVGIAHVICSMIIKTIGLRIAYRLPWAELAWRVPIYTGTAIAEAYIIYLLSQNKAFIKLFSPRAKNKKQTAQNHLKSISQPVSIPGLSRVTELLGRLGDPQNDLKVVHVAGTNGKGSFVAMLSSVLKQAGYTVGSFSSPALTGVTESFRINCKEISGAELEELLSEIEPHCAAMEEKPTEFEVLTAAAYLLFEKERCDIAVVECGMGGLLDATNVLSAPLLSVITNVQKDHCSFLGNTVAEIAAHKAGIIKQGRPVLFGGDAPEALEVIKAEAARLGAPLTVTDHSKTHVKQNDLSGVVMDFGELHDIGLSLLGEYQPVNAANVITAVEILNANGVEISRDALRSGLASASWPGRFELMAKDVIFDGSHNPDGIAYIARSLNACFPERKAVLLVGVMADKDYAAYPALLADCAQKVFAVCPDNPRALSAQKLAECFAEGGISAEAYDDFAEGVKAAYRFSREINAPLAALGTLYMYKDFKTVLEQIV